MMMTMRMPCLVAIYFLAAVTRAESACMGNDSRCAGSTQSECLALSNEGADCDWESSGASAQTTSTESSLDPMSIPEPAPETETMYSTSLELEPAPAPASDESDTTSAQTPTETVTTSTEAARSGEGECEGNDSRCVGSSQTRCNELESEGSDCRWIPSSINTQGVGGDCLGNDSRCAASGHAKCIRLSQQGADCRWESSVTTSSGTCAGNDSRCNERSEQSCNLDGADCKWRADFTRSGSLTLKVSNASSFVQNPTATAAMKEGIANVTQVPSEYIDLDLYEIPLRRLGTQDVVLNESLLVTYVIVVGSHVPASVAVTGDEISVIMHASNMDQIGTAISSKVQETLGSDSFNIVVAEVDYVAAPATNSTSSVISTTSRIVDKVITEDDAALLTGCAHPVLVLSGLVIYLL